MKTLEFETSKGRFVLVDDPILPQAMSITTKYIKLSEITEEQASEIFRGKNIEHTYLKDYNKQKLINVLKSKAIHLFENPIPPFHERLEDFKQAEQKTFYNPYIFKL